MVNLRAIALGLLAFAAMPSAQPAGSGGAAATVPIGQPDVTHELAAQLACLGAATCYGACFVYMRRFVSPRCADPVVVAFGQTASATVILGVLAPFIATAPIQLNPAVVLSMLALGIFGTGMAYVWNTRVIAAWGATNGLDSKQLVFPYPTRSMSAGSACGQPVPNGVAAFATINFPTFCGKVREIVRSG